MTKHKDGDIVEYLPTGLLVYIDNNYYWINNQEIGVKSRLPNKRFENEKVIGNIWGAVHKLYEDSYND